MAPQIARATKFNRIFDPEFLAIRRDITPVELAASQGKLDEVVAAVELDESIIYKKNKDGNILLLLAVANGHLQLSNLLLQLKSNIHHRNSHRLDALDYAVMESIRSPMAQLVLSACDYVITDTFEGKFEKVGKKAIVDLHACGTRLARTDLMGKRPDFSALFARESEYKKEWIANVAYVAKAVKHGVLLLDDDIEYLERDALLSGALEVPVNLRYLYSPTTQKIVKFVNALQGTYEENMERRLVETCLKGDSQAVQGLLKGRATPNSQDLRGETVLSCACHNGDPQTVKCLLVAKAKMNAENKEGFSALHVACVRNNPEAVTVMLKAKADLFARSNKGHNVLDFVKHEGHTQVLQILQYERKDRKDAIAMKKNEGRKKGYL
jgi:hypothetical protein